MGKQKKCESCDCKHEETKFVRCCYCCEKDTGNNRYVLNGMLAYVATYYARSTPLQLKIAISTHYGEYDIIEAKKILVESVKSLEIEVGDAGKDRQNSPNRSAKEAAVEDILLIFRYIDDANIDNNIRPVFCATDLTKVPLAPPEAAGNLTSIYDIIARQEKTILKLVDNMTTLQTDMAQLQSNTQQTMATNSICPPSSYAYKAAQPPRSGTMVPQVMTANGTPPGDMQASISKPENNSAGYPQIYQDISGRPVVPQSRGPNPGQNQKKRVQAKQGSAEKSNLLSAGPTKFMVQITNVNPEKTTEDIKEYIKAQNDSIEPQEVKDTSSEEWHTKRFLITFKIQDFDEVMSDTFWPDSIYFKQWYPARKTSRL